MQPYVIKALQDIEYAYFNNTKLFKTLLDNHIVMDGRFQQLTVSDRVTVQVAVRHPTIKNFQFDIIDTWILDAIGSLYDNGIFYFTADMIIKMVYQDIHHRVSAEIKQKFQQRIDVLLDLQIRLNIDDDCVTRGSEPKDPRFKKKQYNPLLPMEPIDAAFSSNGKQGCGYHLRQSPLLWEYAKFTKQIISCPFDAFSFLRQNRTLETLAILRYVYRRIATMKNSNNNSYSRKISLYRTENQVSKGLLPACNIDPSNFKNWNDKHRKIRLLIEAFLDHLKSADDKKLRIKGYEYYNTNNGEGYHIVLYSQSNKFYKKKENHFYA